MVLKYILYFKFNIHFFQTLLWSSPYVSAKVQVISLMVSIIWQLKNKSYSQPPCIAQLLIVAEQTQRKIN